MTDYSIPVFPARAGMSRRTPMLEHYERGVPRASGDEPQAKNPVYEIWLCSPRERG